MLHLDDPERLNPMEPQADGNGTAGAAYFSGRWKKYEFPLVSIPNAVQSATNKTAIASTRIPN